MNEHLKIGLTALARFVSESGADVDKVTIVLRATDVEAYAQLQQHFCHTTLVRERLDPSGHWAALKFDGVRFAISYQPPEGKPRT